MGSQEQSTTTEQRRQCQQHSINDCPYLEMMTMMTTLRETTKTPVIQKQMKICHLPEEMVCRLNFPRISQTLTDGPAASS